MEGQKRGLECSICRCRRNVYRQWIPNKRCVNKKGIL